MSQFTRTWWGNKFIDGLERFTDSGRLGRGRSYARNDKVKSFKINDGLVMAEVRGSVNPYFGVYKSHYTKLKLSLSRLVRQSGKWRSPKWHQKPASFLGCCSTKCPTILKRLLHPSDCTFYPAAARTLRLLALAQTIAIPANILPEFIIWWRTNWTKIHFYCLNYGGFLRKCCTAN